MPLPPLPPLLVVVLPYPLPHAAAKPLLLLRSFWRSLFPLSILLGRVIAYTDGARFLFKIEKKCGALRAARSE